MTTAAYRIFHDKYRVYIPRSFLYGSEYIRKVGYSATGDKTVDRMQATSLVACTQTIAGMAILHNQGAGLALLREKDAIPIYNTINEHLRDWRSYSSTSINPELCPPMEDFRILEAVAQHFHVYVQEHTESPQGLSKFHESLANLNRGKFNTRAVVVKKEKEKIRPFVSYVRDIEYNLYRR